MDTLNYVALSHQVALRRRLDLIANNLANMSTAGYQRENVVFESYIDKMADAQTKAARPVAFVLDYGVARDTSAGDFVQTNNPLDAAILGSGYFTVEVGKGEKAYTRNGHIKVNGEGLLAAGTGDPLLDTNGQKISIGIEDKNLSIAADGTVSSDLGPKGRLMLTRFQDERLVSKRGGGLLQGEGGVTLKAEEVKLKAGVIEQSNVRAVVETTDMMEVLRTYQSTSQLIDKYDDMRRKGIERLGRVQ